MLLIIIILLVVIVGLIGGAIFIIVNKEDSGKYNDLAIQKAKDVFSQYRIDLKLYKASAINKRGSIIVLFSAADQTDGKGSTGSVPGFEVELRKDTLEVVRSNFVR